MAWLRSTVIVTVCFAAAEPLFTAASFNTTANNGAKCPHANREISSGGFLKKGPTEEGENCSQMLVTLHPQKKKSAQSNPVEVFDFSLLQTIKSFEV